MKTNSIAFKISALSVIFAILMFTLYTTLNFFQAKSSIALVETEVDELVQHNLESITNGITNQLETMQEIQSKQVESNLNVSAMFIEEHGGISEDQSTEVEWNAVNQFTKRSKTVKLPKMMLGNSWLGKNSSFDSETIAVDEIQNMVGGTATIFQRMNEAGDMLRVATNIRKLDNTRAIGTYIPAVNENGIPNGVVRSVLSGQTYRGRAFVVNAWYLTAYQPIFDSNKEVIGILYFGIKQDESGEVRNNIMNTVVGKTGYVFVFNTKGKDRGRFAISLDGKQDGKVILEAKDTDGNFFIKNLIDSATSIDDGDIGFMNYNWLNAGETEPRSKVVCYSYFKEWDWLIGASGYVDDFNVASINLKKEINSSTKISAVSGILMTILLVLVIVFVVRAIVKPLLEMVGVVEKMAEGDLTTKCTSLPNDEVGTMAVALNSTIDKLKGIVGNIKGTTETVASASEELSAVSNQMLAGSEEMVAQSTSVAGATEEMSTNITTMASAAEEMSVNANEVAGAAEQTSQNMNAVSSAVEEMSVSIGQISQDAGTAREVSDQASESSQKATTAMGTLSEAAKEIGNVTEVIKRIAEQTNLLALNATIEAASAGEAGKGFAVVANEIKELANQSAKAADDIATRIDGVQNNTNEAVTVINDVTEVIEKVSSTITNIAQAVEQQNGAVNDISANVVQAGSGVENIAASIAEVAKGANDVSRNSGEASKGATDVTTNIAGIQTAATETSSGAGQVNTSATDLSKMAADLQKIVGQFTI